MARVSLDSIRNALDGVIPANVATCAEDGTPNATYVSQMQYLDPRHVGMSFQFFNKTRQNILANPQATALVIDPVTATIHQLDLLYLHTETEGALFESMRARLAGIASHGGMAGVFKLRGADVYRVLAVERLPGPEIDGPAPRRNLLDALRRASERLAGCAELGQLVDRALDALATEFEIQHAMFLMADEAAKSLYAVGSRGYAATGIGAEIAYGEGVIGVAAQYRTPIRINHMTMEYRYGQASRDGAASNALPLQAQVPFPGLPDPHSQLAVPLLAAGRLLGVLCVESAQDLRFGYDDEDALVALAGQLAGLALALQQEAEAAACGDAPAPAAKPAPVTGAELELRHYRANDCVFVGNDYLIKGVAGAILWKLVRCVVETGRCEFTNRELRMSTDLRLPDLSDNLEARLILLARRLTERCPTLAIEKTGRGRFRLRADRALRLVEADAGP